MSGQMFHATRPGFPLRVFPQTTTMSECSEKVNRGNHRWSNFQPCGREAVKDGLCKIHLNARDRRAEKNRQWDAARARSEELCAEAEQLSKILGVRVTADYNAIGKGGHTGDFVVPADWLRNQARP